MPTTLFPRSTPEAQGVPSRAIREFLSAVAAGGQELHSIMLLRHGHVIAEGWWTPFAPSLPHELFSVSKSVTATAVGIAIHEGLLGLDDRVVDLLPGDAPAEVSENLQAMRVRHLLAMNTGHAEDTLGALHSPERNWARVILRRPVENPPGGAFVYNTGATYLLSAILQRLTGQRLLDYLTPRLLQPLGIEGASWERCPRGFDVGGWGLAITTEDLAKFGQLYLQRGRWNDLQLVPAEWVDAVHERQVSNGDPHDADDWTQGYGYQFWLCRHGAYRADGAFGQLAIIMPEQDAVLALTSALSNTAAVVTAAWDHLLAGLSTPGPLPEDPAGHAELGAALAALAISHPAGSTMSPMAASVSGRNYDLAPNVAHLDGVRVVFAADRAELTLRDEAGEHRIDCGLGTWITGTAAIPEAGSFRRTRRAAVAASGAWADDSTFVARLQAYETPIALLIELAFSAGEITVRLSQNVSFGPTELARSVGVARDARDPHSSGSS